MITNADALLMVYDQSWPNLNLTYAFPTNASNYAAGYGLLDERDTFAPIDPDSHAVFVEAFSRYAEVSGLTFTQAAPGQSADIDIATSTARSVAWAYFPGGLPAAGDIWINTQNSVFDSLVSPPAAYDGLYFFTAVLHELGHAMGLLHGHDVLSADVDGGEHTIMTYRSYVGDPTADFYTNAPGHYAQSIMALDIAAIQAMYGANYNHMAGDTLYEFDPDTGQIRRDGELFNNPAENIIFTTLWDGNGNDTLDFSEYTTSLVIDLEPGAGSNLDAFGDAQRASLGAVNDAPFHFYVALAPDDDERALFENAIGGTSSDTFSGNAANNAFNGGLGLDRYTGFGGSDIAYGSVAELAGDRFTDFTAEDMVVIEGFEGEVTANIVGGGIGLELDFGGETFALEGNFSRSIFEVTTKDGDTSIALAEAGATMLSEAGERFITNDGGANRVFGGDENDVIATSGGADLLLGGGGSDVLLGGDAADTLIGGSEGDRLTGGADADLFVFNASDFGSTPTADFITDFEVGVDKIELAGFGFNSLNDLSFLNLADGDAISLGSGFVVLEGINSNALSNSDFVMLDNAHSVSLISALAQHRLTDAGDRFVTTDAGANEVFAGGGSDAVIGGAGNDILRGEAGSDVLNGGAGADRIIGGAGSDRLTGREGADVFEFAAGEQAGFAADFITDFETADSVLLRGFGFNSVADLTFGTAANGDLTVSLTTSHVVVFEGVTNAATLDNAFDFA